jgi:hypothetical protein
VSSIIAVAQRRRPPYPRKSRPLGSGHLRQAAGAGEIAARTARRPGLDVGAQLSTEPGGRPHRAHRAGIANGDVVGLLGEADHLGAKRQQLVADVGDGLGDGLEQV